MKGPEPSASAFSFVDSKLPSNLNFCPHQPCVCNFARTIRHLSAYSPDRLHYIGSPAEVQVQIDIRRLSRAVMALFGDQLRQVVRRLGRAPLFTAITLFTLAVAIGANA